MAGMDELPSVQALKAHYPSDYRELQAKVSAFSETRPPEEMGALTASVFGAVLKRQLPKADAASVYALRQVTRSYAGALREIDAEGCLRIMEGGAAPASLGKVRTSEMEGADMKATTRLLVQTATAPAPPPRPMSFEELIHLSSAALATMPDRDQDVAIEVLREERDPRTPEEYRIMCDFNLALSDQLLALGPRAGGEKIRAMQAME